MCVTSFARAVKSYAIQVICPKLVSKRAEREKGAGRSFRSHGFIGLTALAD